MALKSSILLTIDVPRPATLNAQPFVLSGWALDPSAASGTGVDTILAFATWLEGTQTRVPLGTARYGLSRPDVAAIHGERFGMSGFELVVRGMHAGPQLLSVYALNASSSVTGTVTTLKIDAEVRPVLKIDSPGEGETVGRSFVVDGWALDVAARTDPGVDLITVCAHPCVEDASSEERRSLLLGAATLGEQRADVADQFGPEFISSGWSLAVQGVPPGAYTIEAELRTTLGGQLKMTRELTIDH